jgi:hypothetical protein
MEYIKVKWLHSDPDMPVWLYSELDKERFETRKVEIFANGHQGYASATEQAKKTRLGLEPVPPLAELASDPEFEPVKITKEEFERVWAERNAQKR